MSLIFLGRMGPKKDYPATDKNGQPLFKDNGDRVLEKTCKQQFKTGVMNFKDKVEGKEPVLAPRLDKKKKQVMKDGKPMFDPMYDGDGKPLLKDVIREVSIALAPKDIGKKIKCGNEKYVYDQGPNFFKKA